MSDVVVIGGGLAGVEAAWQAANLGATVRLYEMRPVKQTPAHQTDKLAEIVCSNSLKSDEPGTASHLLKEELRRGDSLIMEAAAATRVPAGAALAVDRQQFADFITRHIGAHPNIQVIREEATSIPSDAITIVATGPLTSDTLTNEIIKLTAIHLKRHSFRQIAIRHRANHAGHLAGGTGHVVDEQVGRIDYAQPRARGAGHRRAM